MLASDYKSSTQDAKALEQQQKEDTLSVDTSQVITVKPSTVCILEHYDMVSQEQRQEEMNTPEYLVGLTREEIIAYLNSYMLDLPLEEMQDGLISYELIAFSKDNVTLRKTYNSDTVLFRYYIVVEDNIVVVYYQDKKTVYEYTGIDATSLPIEEQTRLSQGIEVKNEKELYGILEDYSS